MKHERIKIKFDNLDTQSKSKLMLGHVNFIDLDSELVDLNDIFDILSRFGVAYSKLFGEK